MVKQNLLKTGNACKRCSDLSHLALSMLVFFSGLGVKTHDGQIELFGKVFAQTVPSPNAFGDLIGQEVENPLLPSEEDSDKEAVSKKSASTPEISIDSVGKPLPPSNAPSDQTPIFATELAKASEEDSEISDVPEEVAPEIITNLDGAIITDPDLRQKAFDAATGGLFPMSPEEIRVFLERLNESQEAVLQPLQPPPEPVIVVENVSLEPSAKLPMIETGTGFVTALSILDATGKPWPIVDVAVGGNFEIVPPDDGGHMIRITPLTQHGQGNLSVRLVDLDTPVSFRIKAGSKKIHYRFDARIPLLGPNAETPLIDQGIEMMAGDSVMLSFLEGLPPTGASLQTVTGADTRTSAWLFNDILYLRTPLKLLSPGWDRSVSGQDGVNVYAVRPTPVILLSDNGVTVKTVLDTAPVVDGDGVVR